MNLCPKIWGQTKFGYKKVLGQNKIMSTNIRGPKNVRVNKYFGAKKFWA